MRVLTDKWNITILGPWNTAIFAPKWVGEHVFGSAEIEIQVEFSLTPGMPTRYRANDVFFLPQPGRIQLAPAAPSEAGAMVRAEEAACLLLDTLPHTPVSAIGVNFGFIEPTPEGKLTSLFSAQDITALSGAGLVIAERELRRKIDSHSGAINLRLVESTDTVTCLVNHHFDTSGAAEAVTAIKGKVEEMRTTTLSILEQIYGLELDEEI